MAVTIANTADTLAVVTSSPLLTNLRAYWELDEPSGTNVYDSTANSFDGTTNATVAATGKIGYCESFNGSSHVATFGTTVGDVGTSDFSIAAWTYTSTTGVNQGIMGSWGTYPYFYMMKYNDNKARGIVNFAGTNLTVVSNSTLATGEWVLIIVTCDRDGYMKLYVNGTLQTDQNNISSHSAVDMSNSNTYNIGNIGSSLSGYWWNGSLDELGLWTKVLSTDDISALWNDGSGVTYPFS